MIEISFTESSNDNFRIIAHWYPQKKEELLSGYIQAVMRKLQ